MRSNGMDARVVFLFFVVGSCYCQIFQYFIVNNKDQTAKVIDTVKLPTCTHLDQKDNVTLRGGIKAGKFTKHGVVKDMKTCIDACCQDETCDVSFMPGNTCYTVNCYSEALCDAIPATPSHISPGGVQISHIIRGGGKGDDVDEFRKKNGVNRNSLPNGDKCLYSRVAYNHSIVGGKQAGEVIDLGKFIDIHDCADKCCQHENCEVAQVMGNKCYAVDCYTKDLCKSKVGSVTDSPTMLVYMNKRNGKRQKHKGSCGKDCANGICSNDGHCMCDVGFKGSKCSEVEDIGMCDVGFKGSKCSEVEDIGMCDVGFKGSKCSEVEDIGMCDVGFKGSKCSEVEDIGKCDPDCGPRGSCLANDTCSCEEGWKGYKCHQPFTCKQPCANGYCINERKNMCKCDVGWTGNLCNESTSDKLVLASSGEEVLFTDSEIEPELDIKIHESPKLHESESISALAVAICCGVAAAVLGTAAVVFIARQMLGTRPVRAYDYLNIPQEKQYYQPVRRQQHP